MAMPVMAVLRLTNSLRFKRSSAFMVRSFEADRANSKRDVRTDSETANTGACGPLLWEEWKSMQTPEVVELLDATLREAKTEKAGESNHRPLSIYCFVKRELVSKTSCVRVDERSVAPVPASAWL